MSKQLDRARDQVTQVVHLSTKRDITEYYRDKYPGDKAWKRQAAIAISGTSDSKATKYKSAMRNFQGQRLTSAGDPKVWREVGKKLPAIGRTLKNDTITITVTGKQAGGHSKRGREREERNRKFTIQMSPSQSQRFVDNPTWENVWDVYGFNFGDYDDDGELEESEDLDIDLEYTLTGVGVSAA